MGLTKSQWITGLCMGLVYAAVKAAGAGGAWYGLIVIPAFVVPLIIGRGDNEEQ